MLFRSFLVFQVAYWSIDPWLQSSSGLEQTYTIFISVDRIYHSVLPHFTQTMSGAIGSHIEGRSEENKDITCGIINSAG